MQVAGQKVSEAFAECPGIRITHAEDHAGEGIREYGGAYFFVALQLPQVLMGQNEAHAILAGTGENFGHAGGDEVLELVGINEKRAALSAIHALPAHGHLLEFGDDEGAKQVRILPAHLSLRELGEEDFPAVHHLCEVEPILALRNHVANRFRREESLQSREDRADTLIASKLGKAALPIEDDLRVGHGGEESLAPIGIKKEAPQIGERAAFAAFKECPDGVAKHCVHLIAP